jgi:hypothetical protein
MARQPDHQVPQNGGPPYRRPSSTASDGLDGLSAETTPEDGSNGLTPIPLSIHWRATTEGGEGSPELDAIAVNHFLDTLAQVALSIASRKLSKEKGDSTC